MEIEVRNNLPSENDEDTENDVNTETTENRQEIGRRGCGRSRIVRTGERGSQETMQTQQTTKSIRKRKMTKRFRTSKGKTRFYCQKFRSEKQSQVPIQKNGWMQWSTR